MEPVHVARATLLLTLARGESNWLDEQERRVSPPASRFL
jgi:hypothetical protein